IILFSTLRHPPAPTLFPYTTLFRSRLKENYGCAYEPMVDPADVIQLPSTVAQGDRQIPRELLAHIIHQRMDEIFNLVQTEISTADRKSTRLNSSHSQISYAVFCLKK